MAGPFHDHLGLSTQIPANVVFVTDGSPRRVSIGKGRQIIEKDWWVVAVLRALFELPYAHQH